MNLVLWSGLLGEHNANLQDNRTRATKDLQRPTLLQQQIGASDDHAPTPALPWSKTAHLCVVSLVSYLSVRRGQSSFLKLQAIGKYFKFC